MEKLLERKITEGKEIEVSSWLSDISKTGQVKEITCYDVREVLKSFGANFNKEKIGIEIFSLLDEYTNKAKAPGLKAVWGDFFQEYKNWTNEFVQNYEKENKTTLPALKRSGNKNSGMIQFFGELTGFAAGRTNYFTLKKHWENRLLNGKLWQEGKKDQRIRIPIIGSEKPILIASIPPGFIEAAWEKIKSNK